MSKVLEEMKTRRSIRKFKPDMIPQDILDRIIEAGTYAANGRGAQNTIIIQVTNKEIRDEIAKRNADIMEVILIHFTVRRLFLSFLERRTGLHMSMMAVL